MASDYCQLNTDYFGRFRTFGLLFFLSLFSLCSSLHADDWYRWRGPDLNGISKETGWFKPWPHNGPRQIWQANVGMGYSTVSVSKGRVFTCGSEKKTQTVYCLDEKSGHPIWTHSFAPAFEPQYYEGGSSGTPTVDGDLVYHLGQMG